MLSPIFNKKRTFFIVETTIYSEYHQNKNEVIYECYSRTGGRWMRAQVYRKDYIPDTFLTAVLPNFPRHDEM